MKKSIQIQIPEPCHEKWETMNPSEKGRFCQACQKNVHDFIHKTDAEILKIFQENQGKVCGRFTAQQLNRPLIPAKKPNFWQKAALFGGFLVLTQFKNAQAEEKPSFKTEQLEKKTADSTVLKKAVFLKKIKGKVIDVETKNNLPGVSIYFKGTSFGCVSDAEGNFELDIPEFDSSKSLTLVFDGVGLETKEIALTNIPENVMNISLNIKMRIDISALNQEIIVGGACMPIPQSLSQALVWKVRDLFYRIIHKY